MKKNIIQRLNAFLAAIIVLLGFNSCHTVKSAEGGEDNKEKTEEKNPPVKPEHNPNIREPQPVVYGPPPSEFREMPRPGQ